VERQRGRHHVHAIPDARRACRPSLHRLRPRRSALYHAGQ
jgi:hypothetical protein